MPRFPGRARRACIGARAHTPLCNGFVVREDDAGGYGLKCLVNINFQSYFSQHIFPVKQSYFEQNLSVTFAKETPH